MEKEKGPIFFILDLFANLVTWDVPNSTKLLTFGISLSFSGFIDINVRPNSVIIHFYNLSQGLTSYATKISFSSRRSILTTTSNEELNKENT